MKARYNYRIYPTSSQTIKLAQLFGCVRVVWNDSLAFAKKQHAQGFKYPGGLSLQKQFITHAKKTEERKWLSEVAAIPLQQSLNDLHLAYQDFFKSCQGKRKGKKLNPPKFKKRKSKQSARFTRNGFKVYEHKVYLAKIGKLKIIWSRPLPSEPSSVTVIKDSSGRYFLSFVVEVQSIPNQAINESVGIDLGIATFATLSDGKKIEAPKPLKKRLKKLKRLNQALSKKQKGSKRKEKARLKVAKLHAKVKDIRTDFLHKLSTELADENQVIVLEDLNVAGMVKNRKLSRAISDLGWRTFRTMLEAKCARDGRELQVISRWEPTSQVCSCCGYRVGKLDLSVRLWKCISCLSEHDRDINAAINIKAAGGQSEAQNGHRGTNQSAAKVANPCEVSTRSEVKQLSLFDLERISLLKEREDVKIRDCEEYRL